MRLAPSTIAPHVLEHRQLLVPLLFLASATFVYAQVPVQHSLFVTSTSWLAVCMPTIAKVGIVSNTTNSRRSLCWLAGAFLSLSCICDRAALDKQGVWATKALLPVLAILLSQNDLLSEHLTLPSFSILNGSAEGPKSAQDLAHTSGSYKLLVASVTCAGVALAINAYTAPSTFMLGTSSVIFAATGLVLFGSLVTTQEDDLINSNALSDSQDSANGATWAQNLAVLRDVAIALFIICSVACYFMEVSIVSTSISWDPAYHQYARDWTSVYNHRILLRILSSIPVHILLNYLTYFTLSQAGSVKASFLTLCSYLSTKLFLAPSLLGIWFTTLYGLSALLYSSGPSVTSTVIEIRSSVRSRRILIGVILFSLGLVIVKNAIGTRQGYPSDSQSKSPLLPPVSPFGLMPMDLTKGHPAAQLIKVAENDFQLTVNKQSKSLAAAVQEYRRRNGIAPPPNFDKWYEFATRNGAVMIDEFDMINEMLMPFWAIKPATLRSRIANALGYEESAMIAVAIRNGAVKHFENGEEWQQQATVGMMKDFVQYLPDMDLGFNIHDEPRVVVPQNLLSSMITKARDEILPRAAKNLSPRNSFSPRPTDLSDGARFIETSTTKFNRFTHQQTWTQSRLSCAPDSQAQTIEDYAPDNITAYAAGPLNYVYNTTAFSDICNTPSLSTTFGFFERPNAFNMVHELTPVFSQSKISSFQDILYPSPWYWAGKVSYNPIHDTTWENKTNSIYWRGSTTGGYSRNGGWRHQHRQHIVRRLNAPDKAQVVQPVSGAPSTNAPERPHELLEIDRRSLKHLINVKFSHIGQCDPGDCDAQKEFFHITERADGQDAWYHKHLLDMDGNAFSGRFYSFLKSRSLTYKMAIFREWHTDWLKPWVHYIPLSLTGDEHLDLIKWFSGDTVLGLDGKPTISKEHADKDGNGDSEGERKAREIAERSTAWHDKVLRNVDFEVWFFRLLLEYGRVIDDKREEIGYSGP